MRQLTSIPKSEQEHALASFWAMMKTCENQADNNADPVLKHQVAGWYQQWNRITGDSHSSIAMQGFFMLFFGNEYSKLPQKILL